LQKIQEHQELRVIFEKALPLRVRPDKLRMEVQGPAVFNMDPLKLLYLLKEKNRAQDFFNKINKDNNDVLTIDEIQTLFTDMGVSVTRSVVEKIMDFMDTDNSGAIDLGTVPRTVSRRVKVNPANFISACVKSFSNGQSVMKG
ncbi:hypothetical protein AM593_04123, partial [Mytilus galloprovincialis]